MSVRAARILFVLGLLAGGSAQPASAQWGWWDGWTTSYYAPAATTSWYAPTWTTSSYGGCGSCGSCGSCGYASYGCGGGSCGSCGTGWMSPLASNCSSCGSCGSCYGSCGASYGGCGSCGCGSCGCSPCGSGSCGTCGSCGGCSVAGGLGPCYGSCGSCGSCGGQACSGAACSGNCSSPNCATDGGSWNARDPQPDPYRGRTQPPASDPYVNPTPSSPSRINRDPGVRDPGVRDPGVRDPGVRDPGVREPDGGFGQDPNSVPGPMRTYREDEGTRANPTGSSTPMGPRNPPGAGDAEFRRTRESQPPMDDFIDPPTGNRPGGTTRPGSGSTTRPPAGGGTGTGDRDMFGTDSPAGRRDSRKMPSDEPMTVPKRDAGDGGREYQDNKPGTGEGARNPLPRIPGPILNLDSKITWRNVPERTRVKVRTGLAIPAVARTVTPAKTDDPNSQWKPAGAATKIVKR